MKHSVFAAIALSLTLSACSELQPTSEAPLARAPGNKQIEVKIENGKIVVPEDRAVTTREHGAVIWNLSSESHSFPRDGIVIDPTNFSPCSPIKDGRSFMCVKRGHSIGDFKYVVNVNAGSNALAPLAPLDPWILNR